MTLPAWIMPGQAADCVVALFGFGRARCRARSVRAPASTCLSAGGTRRRARRCAKPTGTRRLPAPNITTPIVDRMPDDFVRHGTLAEFTADPHFLADHEADAGALSLASRPAPPHGA